MGSYWSKISLFFLFVVALIGTSLRSVGYIPLPFEFKNLVHAHSHIAFQGWIYTIMFLLLLRLFLTQEQIKKGKYALQFKLTIILLVGILVSFSIQGYALYSILFSTLFQILNYWFIFSFFRDFRKTKNTKLNGVADKFIKIGLWLGVLSTLIPFGIGYLSAKDLGGTEIYQSFVYTFLHLQYNGWFLFVAFGLFYKYLDIKEIPYNPRAANTFFLLLSISVIPAISLSLLGMGFSNKLYWIAMATALIQLIAVIAFVYSIVLSVKRICFGNLKWSKIYLAFFLMCYLVKSILQCASVFPGLRSIAFFNKPIILAYLHLSLIGVISFLLLGLLMDLRWIPNYLLAKIGNTLIIVGFVLSELFLVLAGFRLVNYINIPVLAGSLAMLVGIMLLLFTPTRKEMVNSF